MRNAKFVTNHSIGRNISVGFGLKTLAPLASVAVLLTACGGGSGSSSDAQQPLRQVGMQRQYTGSTTQTNLTVNGSGGQTTTTYTVNFTESVNVLQAPASSGAAFDVQAKYVYTPAQNSASGEGPISLTVDSYENLIISGGTQAVSTVGQSSTSTSNDAYSDTLGNGPYIQTETSSSSYTTPVPGLSFPLQTGQTLSTPLPVGSVSSSSFQDVNAAGNSPPDGNSLSFTSQATTHSDGSFNTQSKYANGQVYTTIGNANGSFSVTSTGGTYATSETVGVPVLANGVYTIPVNFSTTSPSVSSTNYSATDWYPGNGPLSLPMSKETSVVVGPVTTLPAACNGALTQPNMFEIDTNETSLSTQGYYQVTTTRKFDANAVAVCTLQQSSQTSYDVLSGVMTSTSTSQTTTILTGLTNPAN